ncbi:MAG TPA: hypothetical protein DEQ43_01615, partial [Nocardioides bacterium]|nr:hypothetical protein [Nocardioides sp.]
DAKTLFAVRRHESRDTLLRISWPDRAVAEIPTPWTYWDGLHLRGDLLAGLASNALTPVTLVTLNTRTGESVARASAGVGLLDPASLAPAEVVSWPTTGAVTCWGIFYRAVGPQAEGPRPLIVHVHGGPTSEAPLAWQPQAQYFATRGWHYLLVNHRGGTGYGRAYQDLLNGQWGVVDVQDARTGAEHLIERGLARADQVVIMGGSAGGYTTLMALTQ